MKTRTMVIVLSLIGLFLLFGYTAAYVIPDNELGIGCGIRGSCSVKQVSGASTYCGANGGNAENCDNYDNGCGEYENECPNSEECPENSENCTEF